jgi:hypothetical protein
MRVIAMLVLAVFAMCASGCLRTKFDLCLQDPSDPNCAFLDAGADVGAESATDAGTDPPSSD